MSVTQTRFIPFLFALALVAPRLVLADCSTVSLAGHWVFATGIGHQMLPGFPPDKDITAIGTMNIGLDGALEGRFDATLQDTVFLPGIPYAGDVQVNEDCTGTLTFVTGAGSMRTDSIVVVGSREILAMSQDPLNLWTYELRRVSGRPGGGAPE